MTFLGMAFLGMTFLGMARLVSHSVSLTGFAIAAAWAGTTK